MTRTNTPLKKYLTNFGAKFLQWVAEYADDLLIIGGLGFIIRASFLVHPIFGFYVLGIIMVGVGWLLAGGPGPKKRGDG